MNETIHPQSKVYDPTNKPAGDIEEAAAGLEGITRFKVVPA